MHDRMPDCQTMRLWVIPHFFETFESDIVHLTLPVSFGRGARSRWVILSGVCARGSKRSHTGGKCVTCSGFTNSREGQLRKPSMTNDDNTSSHKHINVRLLLSDGANCKMEGNVLFSY